jgi:hypothetical protein
MFTGTVVDAERLVNEYSGGDFWHARVRTLGGEVDVVADPQAIEGELVPGGIAQGLFWLSGRLSDEMADREGPFWRKWMGG